MRRTCLAVAMSAAVAMPSWGQSTEETVEVLPDSAVAVPAVPGAPPPSSGTLVLHFKGGSPATTGGTLSPGARISALYLTLLTGCITNVEMSHRPADQLVFIKASFPSTLVINFPFSGLLVDGPWLGTATYNPACGNPSYDVTIPWTVPAPPPPPPPQAVVQGFKLDGTGKRFGNATIFVDGNSTGSANPYGAGMSPNASHVISSSVPAGYSVAFSACQGCTNHPDSSWVFGTSYVGSAGPGGYVDLWWKYFAPPLATLDTKSSYDGNFGGWAFDPSSSSTSIAVHVYVDGPAGSGAAGYAITADGSRPDVNSAFGITGNHGFTFTLPAQYRADGKNHTIYAYAISLFRQPNPLIGTGTYFAPPPPPPPDPTCGPGLISCCGDGTMCRTSCRGVYCP